LDNVGHEEYFDICCVLTSRYFEVTCLTSLMRGFECWTRGIFWYLLCIDK